MNLKFIKFSASGNDFIAIDNRTKILNAENKKLWKDLCALKTGIGADGVLLIEDSSQYDFKMRYINADGSEAEMCGNGALSITFFAFILGIIPNNQNRNKFHFETINATYKSHLITGDNSTTEVKVKLSLNPPSEVNAIDLSQYSTFEKSIYLNTGVPHCVFWVKDINSIDVVEVGKKIRNNKKLFEKGTNVNFIQKGGADHSIHLRTYEKGVEDETLACGTGAVASAIATSMFVGPSEKINVITKGGELEICLSDDFQEISLTGRVKKVFEGIINID